VAKTITDRIYLSSDPTLINAYYPASAVSLIAGDNLQIDVANAKQFKDTNKDVVYATGLFTKNLTGNYSLTFQHLFSLLEVELKKGNTTDDLNIFYPIYTAKSVAKIAPPYTDIYTSSASNKHYFFDNGAPNIYGCVISNDIDGYIILNMNNTDLPEKIFLKDYFTTIDAGKKYKITITINQNSLEVGNVTISNWIDGGNGSISITTP